MSLLNGKGYEKRSSEIAQTAGNMGPVQILVRTGGVFLGGFYLGLFLTSMINIDSIFGFVGCVLVSSLVIYALMELILSRNVARVVSNWKAALVSSVGVAVVVYLVISGGFGYVSRMPVIDNVESVEIECSPSYDNYYPYVVYNTNDDTG